MAHFAKLDENNIVTQVITFSNDEVNANGGDLSIEAENFVAARHPGTWKQTSYNNNFRKQYCGIGFTYDSVKNKFIASNSYASWSLDENDDWKAPVEKPTEEQCNYTYNNEPFKYIWAKWDEDLQKWTSLHGDDSVYQWDGTSWSPIN